MARVTTRAPIVEIEKLAFFDKGAYLKSDNL